MKKPRRSTAEACHAWFANMRCKNCDSYAINPHLHGRDGSRPDLCDVCYWRDKAESKPPVRSSELVRCGREKRDGLAHVTPANAANGTTSAFICAKLESYANRRNLIRRTTS